MSTLDRLPDEWVERIFMRLHGRFGNTFFNKFKTGVNNANGEDSGIVNAKATWAHELRGTTSTRIKNGLESSYDKAPDCDLFKSKCVLQAEVQDYKRLPASAPTERGQEFASNVVEFAAKAQKESRDWVKYWQSILTQKDLPMITYESARQALKQLGAAA